MFDQTGLAMLVEAEDFWGSLISSMGYLVNGLSSSISSDSVVYFEIYQVKSSIQCQALQFLRL